MSGRRLGRGPSQDLLGSRGSDWLGQISVNFAVASHTERHHVPRAVWATWDQARGLTLHLGVAADLAGHRLEPLDELSTRSRSRARSKLVVVTPAQPLRHVDPLAPLFGARADGLIPTSSDLARPAALGVSVGSVLLRRRTAIDALNLLRQPSPVVARPAALVPREDSPPALLASAPGHRLGRLAGSANLRVLGHPSPARGADGGNRVRPPTPLALPTDGGFRSSAVGTGFLFPPHNSHPQCIGSLVGFYHMRST